MFVAYSKTKWKELIQEEEGKYRDLVLLADRSIKPKDFKIKGSNMIDMFINRESYVLYGSRRVCVCVTNCWPNVVLGNDMNARSSCPNISYTGELRKYKGPRYGRGTSDKAAFRKTMTLGSVFCSPLPDEQIPDGTRLNNNFIVCYDLVKIWKEPFENPYKLGAKYKVDGETTWHKIDGNVHRMDVKQGTWLVGVQFAKYDNSSNATNGRLYWQWEKNKEYAECYNLAETEKKIELRNQRDGSGKFSISIAQHDMLRTLDGYDDSGD